MRRGFHEHLHRRLHDHLHDHLHGHPHDPHELWASRHSELRFGHRWRHFCGAHLRRRLFLWFGASIVLTALAVASLAHMMRAGQGRPHVPGLVFLLVPVVILWAAAGKVARRIARPLDELVRVAQDIGAGRLGARARLECGGIDEIADLSRAVNDMAERIERQLADQRELLAGVSHEIRTPLARLRLLVEIGRERPEMTNLDEIEREVMEIDALVGELLASARLDFSALTPMPLDAREVAGRAAERAGVATDRVIVETGDSGFVGDPTLLARALANLLENARLHGGGVDALRVRGEAATVEFIVQDRGPGFPAGQEQRVFDRFYRPQVGVDAAGAAAATDGGNAAGLGLGLALVRRIAEAHGGQVTGSNRRDTDGGGAGRRGGAATVAVAGAEVCLSIPRAFVDGR